MRGSEFRGRLSIAAGQRAADLFRAQQQEVYRNTDRLFAKLMICQWIGAIVLAVWVSPTAWDGQVSRIHLHVWLAVFLGGVITGLPVTLALLQPGKPLTRYVVSVGQMLMSALLIHITGGRIETHFHVFGSLAFLAFYRDWRILIPASTVVAADHFFRGIYFPQSVFGVVAVGSLRWLEHAAWVVFEDFFLIKACLRSVKEMEDIAERQAKLEATGEILLEKTNALTETNAAFAVEISERKRTAMELLAAKEAAEAGLRARNEFLANISHEIRTPMNGIIGMTELVLDGELNPQQREFMSMVGASANGMMSIINDLLDYSKMEALKLTLDSVPFRLSELLNATIEPLAITARDKDLVLSTRLENGIPDLLVGDPGRLRQVLTNLIANATKFTEKGSVTVSIEMAERSSTKVCLHCSVQDTGIGISKDKLELIFAPFEQADMSTTRRFGGTGLGLAICSQLVNLMNGKIWVESELGTGSTFHFIAEFGFDIAIALHPTVPTRESASEEMTQPLSILLAEDNRINQRVATNLLSKMGHAVVVVENGNAAVQALADRSFDLVLMDIHMPVMDGLEATRVIRAREGRSGMNTRIIAVTASATADDRAECLTAGMDGYISKPISRRELQAVIEAVLGIGRMPDSLTAAVVSPRHTL